MRRLLPLALLLLLLPASASALDTSKFAGCVADGLRGSCKKTWYGGDSFGATFINQSGHKHRYRVVVTRRPSGKVAFRKRRVSRRFIPLTGLSAGRYRVRWYIGSTQVGGWTFTLKVEPEAW